MKHTYNLLEKEYTFSIIIPVYNTGCYLEECLDSIIHQENVNFTEEVQVIIVNDGSNDNSEEIIKEYITKYPNNIMYIYQSNQGVSSARNKGLTYAKGQYIHFLDSDDKLSNNTLENVNLIFNKYGSLIDVVSIPIYFFEGKSESHILNYKFKKEVIDIEKDYTYIQMSISGTFIRLEALEDDKFDVHLKYGEDAQLVTKIILKKKKYAAAREGKYLYRYRREMNSTLQKANLDKEWFIGSIEKFTFSILESNKKNERLSKYIQYVLIYDISWKVMNSRRSSNTLTYSEWIVFYQRIKGLLKYIDIEVIKNLSNMPLKYKGLLVMLKLIPGLGIIKLWSRMITKNGGNSSEGK